MTRTVSNTEDVLDSRDIIARIEELEAERDAYDDADAGPNETPAQAVTPWSLACSDDAAELAALSKLAEEAEGYAPDWKYGQTLIRDSYFTEYTEEMIEEYGYISKDLPGWIVLDMEATAKNIQQDYTSVDFDGVTYWIR